MTYIKELNLITTCAFDQQDYVWNAELPEPERVGSLLLGNKALPPGATMDNEMRRYKAQWKVQIDKLTRYEEEL